MATPKISAALRTALEQVDTQPGDAAIVRLAQTYARAIDDGDDLHRLGPQLLAVLVELGMTPKARAAVTKGGQRDQPTSPLDELRQRRTRRLRDTSAVDATAT